MIYGIGTDICDIRRVEATMSRQGKRFIERILGENEQAIYYARAERSSARGLRYVATRFSSKEAFSKAIGLGIHSPMRWRDCEVLSTPSGKPELVLHGELQRWCAERGLKFSISLSDESDYASSFVVAEVVAAD